MADCGKTPKTLYSSAISCYVAKLNYSITVMNSIQGLRYLPPGVLIDVYVLMSQQDELKDMLFEQLSDLGIFERLLRFDPARQKLFRCLNLLMSRGKRLAKQLQENFTLLHRMEKKTSKAAHCVAAKSNLDRKLIIAALRETNATTSVYDVLNAMKSKGFKETESKVITDTYIVIGQDDAVVINGLEVAGEGDKDFPANSTSRETTDNGFVIVMNETEAVACNDDVPHLNTEVVDFGLRLGSFLSEAGWLSESIQVLQCVASHLRQRASTENKSIAIHLDCLQRLLHSEAALCSFKSAERTFDEIVRLLKESPPDAIPKSLQANIYTQFSALYFARSEYDDSHTWSVVAMRHLEDTTPERIAIDVLRQAAKACVVKRDFQRANMLICQASNRARKVFGPKHQKYADTLLDYGFFLLNVDSVYQSVVVYKDALDIKRFIFGDRNFHVGIAHEDLSYAYYVHEYSTGNFTCAREHVEKAVDIMKELVPHDHLMLASAKRVKALLLEEIALDKIADGSADEDGLLKESESLHIFALKLSLEVFGEVNVQTAKHYGNLGRLYQTMSRFEEAESMHKKAIKIKTDLLGPYDYEVGLSIGHLASLYNYQMKKYREAEQLYFRSIDISLRLFGRSYSGLEYDYLGLCHVYETLHEFERYLKYANILENWQMLRGQNVTLNKTFYPATSEDRPLKDVIYQFFHMCTQTTPLQSISQ